MLPASNKGVGMNLGFPDVCLTPPVPLPMPYPNLALNAMAVPFSPVVKVSMLPALNMASFIPMTMGDEAGLAHPTFKGTGRYLMGNPVIHIDMLPAINLCCPTVGNNFNNPLGMVVVPSLTNVFFTRRSVAAGELGRRTAFPEIDSLLAAPGVGQVNESDESTAPGQNVQSVESSLLGEGIGYVAIRAMSLDVPARVHGAVQALSAAGMHTLVLDLRDNPGGELTAFLKLAGDFLAAGKVIARVVDSDGDETVIRGTRRDPYAMPLWIVVDRWTASAAELFAGCLQCHSRALIAGEKTYGKGLARELLTAACATVLLPDGHSIHGAGVVPDVALGG